MFTVTNWCWTNSHLSNLGVATWDWDYSLQSCTICTIIPGLTSLWYLIDSIQQVYRRKTQLFLMKILVEHRHLHVFFSWHYDTQHNVIISSRQSPHLSCSAKHLCIFVKVPYQFSWSVAFSRLPIFEVQVVFNERTLLLKNYVRLSLLWSSWILNWTVERLSSFRKHCTFEDP